MDIDLILTELAAFNGELPRLALEAAIEQQDEITSHLLKVLEDIAEDPSIMLEEPDLMLPIYALYLLAFFKEPKAFPLIIKLFTTQDEDFIDAFGDFVTEDLCRVLASTYSGDIALLNQMIESDSIDGFVRSAGISTYVLLYLNDTLSREQVVAYFKSLYEYKLAKDSEHVWDSLVCCSCDIYPKELLPHIRQAFAQELVDTEWGTLDDVQIYLDDGLDITLSNTKDGVRGLVGHPSEELQYLEKADEDFLDDLKVIEHMLKSQVDKSPKIGRNEPCFCGSGKKYKKCCLTL
ncbi:MAG: DUF1186 domain-containing protein [Pseudomonadota bacterium]|nr:DUF1186 domain-containing protein [Pseudomonadota bacterium]